MNRRRKSGFGAFFAGFFMALFLVVISGFLLVNYTLKHPQKIAEKAAQMGLVKVVEKTVVQTVTKTISSIPRDQVAIRQDRINQSVQNLTQSFSENRLDFDDLQVLGDQVFQAAADQQVTTKEIDALLDLADKLGR
ncbi:hypothetical protein HQ585_02650 [candidate division KSB1 bacterium]|nr:hypothetical protein [candidate division KSB1 bacterium]